MRDGVLPTCCNARYSAQALTLQSIKIWLTSWIYLKRLADDVLCVAQPDAFHRHLGVLRQTIYGYPCPEHSHTRSALAGGFLYLAMRPHLVLTSYVLLSWHSVEEIFTGVVVLTNAIFSLATLVVPGFWRHRVAQRLIMEMPILAYNIMPLLVLLVPTRQGVPSVLADQIPQRSVHIVCYAMWAADFPTVATAVAVSMASTCGTMALLHHQQVPVTYQPLTVLLLLVLASLSALTWTAVRDGLLPPTFFARYCICGRLLRSLGIWKPPIAAATAGSGGAKGGGATQLPAGEGAPADVGKQCSWGSDPGLDEAAEPPCGGVTGASDEPHTSAEEEVAAAAAAGTGGSCSTGTTTLPCSPRQYQLQQLSIPKHPPLPRLSVLFPLARQRALQLLPMLREATANDRSAETQGLSELTTTTAASAHLSPSAEPATPHRHDVHGRMQGRGSWDLQGAAVHGLDAAAEAASGGAQAGMVAMQLAPQPRRQRFVTQYRHNVLRIRIDGANPEDLPPNWQELVFSHFSNGLPERCLVSGVAVRRGSIHVTVSLVQLPHPRDGAGGAEGAAAAAADPGAVAAANNPAAGVAADADADAPAGRQLPMHGGAAAAGVPACAAEAQDQEGDAHGSSEGRRAGGFAAAGGSRETASGGSAGSTAAGASTSGSASTDGASTPRRAVRYTQRHHYYPPQRRSQHPRPRPQEPQPQPQRQPQPHEPRNQGAEAGLGSSTSAAAASVGIGSISGVGRGSSGGTPKQADAASALRALAGGGSMDSAPRSTEPPFQDTHNNSFTSPFTWSSYHPTSLLPRPTTASGSPAGSQLLLGSSDLAHLPPGVFSPPHGRRRITGVWRPDRLTTPPCASSSPASTPGNSNNPLLLLDTATTAAVTTAAAAAAAAIAAAGDSSNPSLVSPATTAACNASAAAGAPGSGADTSGAGADSGGGGGYIPMRYTPMLSPAQQATLCGAPGSSYSNELLLACRGSTMTAGSVRTGGSAGAAAAAMQVAQLLDAMQLRSHDAGSRELRQHGGRTGGTTTGPLSAVSQLDGGLPLHLRQVLGAGGGWEADEGPDSSWEAEGLYERPLPPPSQQSLPLVGFGGAGLQMQVQPRRWGEEMTPPARSGTTATGLWLQDMMSTTESPPPVPLAPQSAGSLSALSPLQQVLIAHAEAQAQFSSPSSHMHHYPLPTTAAAMTATGPQPQPAGGLRPAGLAVLASPATLPVRDVVVQPVLICKAPLLFAAAAGPLAASIPAPAPAASPASAAPPTPSASGAPPPAATAAVPPVTELHISLLCTPVTVSELSVMLRYCGPASVFGQQSYLPVQLQLDSTSPAVASAIRLQAAAVERERRGDAGDTQAARDVADESAAAATILPARATVRTALSDLACPGVLYVEIWHGPQLCACLPVLLLPESAAAWAHEICCLWQQQAEESEAAAAAASAADPAVPSAGSSAAAVQAAAHQLVEDLGGWLTYAAHKRYAAELAALAAAAAATAAAGPALPPVRAVQSLPEDSSAARPSSSAPQSNDLFPTLTRDEEGRGSGSGGGVGWAPLSANAATPPPPTIAIPSLQQRPQQPQQVLMPYTGGAASGVDCDRELFHDMMLQDGYNWLADCVEAGYCGLACALMESLLAVGCTAADVVRTCRSADGLPLMYAATLSGNPAMLHLVSLWAQVTRVDMGWVPVAPPSAAEEEVVSALPGAFGSEVMAAGIPSAASVAHVAVVGEVSGRSSSNGGNVSTGAGILDGGRSMSSSGGGGRPSNLGRSSSSSSSGGSMDLGVVALRGRSSNGGSGRLSNLGRSSTSGGGGGGGSVTEGDMHSPLETSATSAPAPQIPLHPQPHGTAAASSTDGSSQPPAATTMTNSHTDTAPPQAARPSSAPVATAAISSTGAVATAAAALGFAAVCGCMRVATRLRAVAHGALRHLEGCLAAVTGSAAQAAVRRLGAAAMQAGEAAVTGLHSLLLQTRRWASAEQEEEERRFLSYYQQRHSGFFSAWCWGMVALFVASAGHYLLSAQWRSLALSPLSHWMYVVCAAADAAGAAAAYRGRIEALAAAMHLSHIAAKMLVCAGLEAFPVDLKQQVWMDVLACATMSSLCEPVRLCVACPLRLLNFAFTALLYGMSGLVPAREALLLSASCHGLGLLLHHALESHYRRDFAREAAAGSSGGLSMDGGAGGAGAAVTGPSEGASLAPPDAGCSSAGGDLGPVAGSSLAQECGGEGGASGEGCAADESAFPGDGPEAATAEGDDGGSGCSVSEEPEQPLLVSASDALALPLPTQLALSEAAAAPLDNMLSERAAVMPSFLPRRNSSSANAGPTDTVDGSREGAPQADARSAEVMVSPQNASMNINMSASGAGSGAGTSVCEGGVLRAVAHARGTCNFDCSGKARREEDELCLLEAVWESLEEEGLSGVVGRQMQRRQRERDTANAALAPSPTSLPARLPGAFAGDEEAAAAEQQQEMRELYRLLSSPAAPPAGALLLADTGAPPSSPFLSALTREPFESQQLPAPPQPHSTHLHYRMEGGQRSQQQPQQRLRSAPGGADMWRFDAGQSSAAGASSSYGGDGTSSIGCGVVASARAADRPTGHKLVDAGTGAITAAAAAAVERPPSMVPATPSAGDVELASPFSSSTYTGAAADCGLPGATDGASSAVFPRNSRTDSSDHRGRSRGRGSGSGSSIGSSSNSSVRYGSSGGGSSGGSGAKKWANRAADWFNSAFRRRSSRGRELGREGSETTLKQAAGSVVTPPTPTGVSRGLPRPKLNLTRETPEGARDRLVSVCT